MSDTPPEPATADAITEGGDSAFATSDSTGDALIRAVIGTTRRAAPVALVPGQLLDDTYRIVRTLGSGGMGIVYLARDQKLGRDVAIKLHTTTEASPRGVERLMREASAIAQLSHVNVVTVYQVDTYERRPFVAMEYVDGGTARTWLQETHTWREIVALYVAAGRGLAAAHRAGLVHRDFKPDNVLVGTDGRVRVADFGLVQGAVPTDSGAGDSGADEPIEDADGRLTRSGAVMGTPAYMAPEQHRALEVGPAADQFAFCVSLWEALDGARPFAGATRATLLEAIDGGRVREPTPDRSIPRHVRRALTRGLAADPAARFPTLDALLQTLAWDPATRRRRLALGAAGIVLLGGGVATWALTRDDPAAKCRSAATLAGSWDDARRGAVEQAFLGTTKPHAAATFTRTAAQLDRYAGGWIGARIEACRATHVRGDQSAQLLDLRYACLDQRRAKLRALVDLFAAAPDPKLLDGAVTASLKLDDVEACADLPALSGMPPRPREAKARAEIERLEASVAETDALVTAGRFADGLAIATPTVEAARAAGYAPVLARALRSLAAVQTGTGDHVAAKATIRESARVGAEAHDDLGVASGWIYMLHLLVSETEELDEAEDLIPVVEAAVARAGNPTKLQLGLDSNVGSLRTAQGRYDEARALLERALATAERELPREDPALSSTLNRLANALARQGNLVEARAYLERTITLQEETLGPEHPYIAMALHNLGGVIFRSGAYEESLAVYQRSLAMKEKLLGADHRDLSNTLSNLGITLRNLGRYAEARPYLERAVVIAEASFGVDHPSYAQAMLNVAGVVGSLGSYDEAIPMFERAFALLEQRVGADHPDLADVLIEMGNLRNATGDHAGARRDLERARRILEASVGRDHADTAAAVASLADVLVNEDKLQDALAMYEEALAITIKAVGEAHPQVGKVEASMGYLELQVGDLPAARRRFTSAQQRFEAAFGPEHREIARVLFGLAQIDLRTDADADAQAKLERAVAMLEKASGPDHPTLADPLTSLAKAHLYQGHGAEALAAAERATAVQVGHADDPRSVAETAFILAQARWLVGDDRPAALKAARTALDALIKAGAPAKDIAVFEAWLRNPQK